MRRLDFARFISQDATLKCGNDFLSLSMRLPTGSCTSDWLKLKARSGLGGRDLVRNLSRRYKSQTNNRRIRFPPRHFLFKSTPLWKESPNSHKSVFSVCFTRVNLSRSLRKSFTFKKLALKLIHTNVFMSNSCLYI